MPAYDLLDIAIDRLVKAIATGSKLKVIEEVGMVQMAAKVLVLWEFTQVQERKDYTEQEVEAAVAELLTRRCT